MTVNRGPGVAKNGAVGVTTLEHRLQLAGQYAENAPGVPRSGVLAQASAVLVTPRADGMSWDVSGFQSVINRTASEGVYTPTLTGITNVASIAAPGSNSRWDLVYLKQNDMAKGDADNLAVLGVIQGTAAASPTKPTGSLPSGALLLAESRIFAGTSAAQEGSNTTAQVWRHTAARGAPVPVRSTAERDEITTPVNGQQVVRLDVTGFPVETWDSANWTRELETISAVTDGNFTITGHLLRSKVGGKTMVTAALQMIRSNAVGITLTTGGIAIIVAAIPAGWRPPGNFSLIGSVTDASDARYAEPELIINNGGSIVGRSTSGGSVTISQNYKLYISGSWFV